MGKYSQVSSEDGAHWLAETGTHIKGENRYIYIIYCSDEEHIVGVQELANLQKGQVGQRGRCK